MEMFKNIGWLADYPHIIGFSNQLKKNSYFKRCFYNIPLLLLRDTEGVVHVYFDVCPHKRGPLEAKWNEIFCSYHGWRFNQSWEIIKIPSSPHVEKKLKCKLLNIRVEEKYWLIWIFPKSTSEHKIPELEKVIDKNWRNYYTEKVFDTNDDSLIENFMDATHTPIVHDGVVRTDTHKTKHTIIIEQKDNRISATFWETQEHVWLGINYFLRKKLTISHTDTFLPPNLIQVNYKINNIDRFQAFIWCNQSEDWKSHAYFRISYNFWPVLNFLLPCILPFLVKKVLKQDYDITLRQTQNQKYFPHIRENHIDYDILHNKVRILKQKIQQWSDTSADISQNTIHIYV